MASSIVADQSLDDKWARVELARAAANVANDEMTRGDFADATAAAADAAFEAAGEYLAAVEDGEYESDEAAEFFNGVAEYRRAIYDRDGAPHADAVRSFDRRVSVAADVSTPSIIPRELSESYRDRLFRTIIGERNPVTGNIESYNHWLDHVLPRQIQQKISYNPTSVFVLENVRIMRPMIGNEPLWPYRARKTGLTYAGALVADLRSVVAPTRARAARAADPGKVISTIVKRDHVFATIPVMLGSKACHLHGLSPDERVAVYEDRNDPLGHFIIRGGERVVMNQENLAFAQMVSSENSDAMETRVTFQCYGGTTLLRVFKESSSPRLYVNVCQAGMKGNVTVSPWYPVVAFADALFQTSNPDLYLYEVGDDGAVADDATEKRDAIVAEFLRLVTLFVPAEFASQVRYFLSASIVRYATMKNPMNEILLRKAVRTTRDVVSQSAHLQSAMRNTHHALVRYVESHGEDEAARDAAIRATEIETACSSGRVSVVDMARTVMTDIFSDVFPTVDLADKPMHFARIVARQCLVAIGARSLDDRDAWENKRVKPVSEWMAQQFNAYFKTSLNASPGTGNRLTVNSALSDQFVAAFSTAATGTKESMIQVAKRDTQMALTAQLSKIDSSVPRQNKQFALRLVQMSQLGYVCPAETPSGASCGLTKSYACTAVISFRRSAEDYLAAIARPTVAAAIADGEAARSPSDEFRVPVVVETAIVGWSRSPRRLYDRLRLATKRDLDFFDVSVTYNAVDGIIEIFVSGSRPTRPLFTVDLDAGALTIDTLDDEERVEAYTRASTRELVAKGLIEYVTAAEQQYFFVCRDPRLVPGAIAARREKIAATAAARAALADARTARAIAKAERALADIEARDDMDSFLPMYSEIDPVAQFGIPAALMPMPNTCQGPRVNYQSNMLAQALGTYHSTAHSRFDSAFKVVEGSRPTFETRVARPLGLNRAPTGDTFIVAYCGLADNGEDGLIFKKEALERTKMLKFATHKTTARAPPTPAASGVAYPAGTIYEEFTLPDEAVGLEAVSHKAAIYRALDANGIPRVGATISKGMAIVGRVRITVGADGEIDRANASIFAGVGEKGVVDRVDVSPMYVERAGNSEVVGTTVRVKLRDTRDNIPGDKYASRYSQKGTMAAMRSNLTLTRPGVVTGDAAATARIAALGAVADSDDASRVALKTALIQESSATVDEGDVAAASLVRSRVAFASTLPVIASGPNAGITPDVFINPHSMPTRMTIGMLYEVLACAASVHLGERVDATAFRGLSDETIDHYSTVAGDGAYEEMVHPDGTKWREGVKAFVGPCYYQYLRHHVLDKVQSRAEGNIMRLTHQPVGGRSREGGIRQGEMEKSGMASWGAADLLRERLMLSSDAFNYEICTTCGNQAFMNHVHGERACRVCPRGEEKIAVVTTPMINLLIGRLVAGLGIHTRFSHTRPTERLPDF